MTQEKSPAELMFSEALARYVELNAPVGDAVNFDTSEVMVKNPLSPLWVIHLFQQALSLGLTGKDEVQCHALLGHVCMQSQDYDRAESIRHSVEGVFEKGLKSVPNYHRGVLEIEKALELDAQRGGEFFGNSLNRAAILSEAGFLWTAHSQFLERSVGVNDATSYLEEKMKLLDYLGDSYLPMVSLTLGDLHAKNENIDIATKWFQRAASADADGNQVSEEMKGRAQARLQILLNSRK